MAEITQQALEQFAKQATDRGLLIEAGWLGLRAIAVPLDAPQVQIDGMREAFFAGAQHLFSSIISILDPGSEPTEKDLTRMTMIQSELEEFIRQYKLKHRL